MDKLHIQDVQPSQLDNGRNIHVSRVSPRSRLHTPVNGIRDGIASNAKRLELRNAGFRAALLPARRITPPQTNIGHTIGGWTSKNENLGNSVKKRQSSSSRNHSPLNVLQEISNSATRRTTLRQFSDNIGRFSDDERDLSPSPCPNTMLDRARPIKSVVHRKKARRTSSTSESTKYIEYLESQLGATTEKLEKLRSPETVKGQALKIRKLEKRLQEVSQHVADWEKNYEERVNDEVFERLHGESDLRLKILTLEEAAGHKEAHISELAKELEETKIKLIESESAEVTLNKRVDVLTELLAKSPTRTRFPPNMFDTGTDTNSQSTTRRMSVSPTRSFARTQPLDGLLQSNDLLGSNNDTIVAVDHRLRDCMEGDSESLASDVFSRPTSGIFTSHSSQSSFSRPTSIFSATSFSILESVEERPVNRPRRSRRFAPGSSGLKPLLLPTAAGLPGPETYFETPKKASLVRADTDESPWGSVGELGSPTPSRRPPRRPYSWTPGAESRRSDTDKHENQNVHEDDPTEDDTFACESPENDDLPAYLRHFASSLHPTDVDGQTLTSSPPRATLSLHQELGELEDSNRDDADAGRTKSETPRTPSCRELGDVCHSTASSHKNSLRSLSQGCVEVFDTSTSLYHSTRSENTNLVISARQRTLLLAQRILQQSWTVGSARFGGLIWWLLDLSGILKGRNKAQSAVTSNIQRSNSSTIRAYLVKVLSQIRAFVFSSSDRANYHQCPHCSQPRGSKQLKLWTKLALAMTFAIGYAMVEGPAKLMEPELVSNNVGTIQQVQDGS